MRNSSVKYNYSLFLCRRNIERGEPMPASNHKVGSPINVWQSLANKITGQGAYVRQKWDEVGEVVRLKHDSLCDYIDTYIATKTDLAGVVLGQIADGTITAAKFAANALQANVTKLSTATSTASGGQTTVDGAILALCPSLLYFGKYSQMSGGAAVGYPPALITFSAEDNDDFGTITIGTSASRISIPASLNGKKAVFYWHGSCSADGYSGDGVAVHLYKNGAYLQTLTSQNGAAGIGPLSNGQFRSLPVALATNDFYEIYGATNGTASHHSGVSSGSAFGMEVLK